ncbi:MAG: hypothetical protein AMS27_01835 [Bacteroides sp. SM23_62_1]|nr:MAG: hypothetical protein AMS27_01835 [Bacteroides sp. SM23_62_1]
MIFIYSGLFSAEKDNHPIPSIYEKITGEPTASSGLSRSFSEIVRGRFDSARSYNQYGIPVFIFFFIQFFQRIIVSILRYKMTIHRRWLLIGDVIISIALFLYCFKGFIRDFLNNFS